MGRDTNLGVTSTLINISSQEMDKMSQRERVQTHCEDSFDVKGSRQLGSSQGILKHQVRLPSAFKTTILKSIY